MLLMVNKLYEQPGGCETLELNLRQSNRVTLVSQFSRVSASLIPTTSFFECQMPLV